MQKRQQRRVFEAAFKVEAVRRLHERLANNIPLSVIARELAVRPQQLRGWEKQLASPVGQAVHDVFPGGRLPSAEEEVRRLRRESPQGR